MKRALVITLCISALLVTPCFSLDANSLRHGYELNKKYCMSCHDSVADPEKVGLTRDTWHLVLNIMHKHGLEKLSAEDTAALVDYFYSIRQGMERSPG